MYEVQHSLGHSSAALTEHYAHLTSKSLIAAAESESAFIQVPGVAPGDANAAVAVPTDMVQVQIVTVDRAGLVLVNNGLGSLASM